MAIYDRGGMQGATNRSVRINNETWGKALRRAAKDGLTMSEVINRFVEGYANGDTDVPSRELVWNTSK